MKARLVLTLLLVCSLFYLNSTFAQNEIEKYKQPELIKGSNLYASFSPGFFNYYKNDSVSNETIHANFSAQYVRWRFTRRLDYSADIRSTASFGRSSSSVPGYSFAENNTYAQINLTGGISYYPIKDKLYGGLYISSASNFYNHLKPHSNNDIYGYAGTGRLLNAGQIMYALNFSNVLVDEGLTSKPLPAQVLRKLTVLLDKRRNSEFTSKYKDDADIEFFSQIENLLRDEKIISGPMSSRTTLKLFQALLNSKFIYFPRYRGYLLQTELSFSTGQNRDPYGRQQGNTVRLILSGVYGLPIGLNTDLVFSGFTGIPLNNQYNALIDYPFFHSPLILRDYSVTYYPSPIQPLDTEKYKITGGIKALVYHNISPMMGISAFLNLGYGKSEDKKDNFVFSTVLNFRYNILSRMVLNSIAEFNRYQNRAVNFATSLELSYIVF